MRHQRKRGFPLKPITVLFRLMIDTVQLRHRIVLPSKAELSALGFHRVIKRSPSKTTWVKNATRRSASQPRFTWSQTNGGDWLSVEVSLPKLLFGRNTLLLTEHNTSDALRLLSNFVFETVGVDFDAMTAIVGRIDYYFDFNVGETNAFPYLTTASRATLPYTRRHIVGNSVSFGNRSKRIVIYDKHVEVISRRGLVNAEELEESNGVLRLEARHLTSRACNRLKQKHGLPFPTSQSLCSLAVARKELSSTLVALGLDREILNPGSRIDRLREYYGDIRLVRSLIAFIALFESYGEEFWRLGVAGYSKSLYYEHMRLVKKANALLCAETTLPPLRLPPEEFFSRAA